MKEWYAKIAGSEWWRRLTRDAYHEIEFTITMHFPHKCLPKIGLVLDAGGGQGRYTVELAKKAYEVVLLDITPRMLKIAERQIKKAKVGNRVKQIVEGSISDLSTFGDEIFGAILCLGAPLSHLLEEDERQKNRSKS